MTGDVATDRIAKADFQQTKVGNQAPGEIPDAQGRLSEVIADESRHDEPRYNIHHVTAPGKRDIAPKVLATIIGG